MPYIDHERETGARDPAPASPIEWRFGRLVDTGFPRGLAARLARDTRYDLHELVDLVERGCVPALAARILAPLDDGAHAA
ncbi:MAG: hypothetical protein M5U27_08915 [Gaiella sp.]|nr:hypothetical protein [Gaiella sp.]